MKVDFAGGSYVDFSLPLDAQRSVNCYPVGSEKGKSQIAMRGTPGLASFASAGLGPVRGMFMSDFGRAFACSGAFLYEVLSDGTVVQRGELPTNSGAVTMDENTQQLALCDGQRLYILNYATNDFQQVVSASFPTSVGSVAFDGGYFIVNQNGTGRFFISGINNGLVWDALDFATAESSPDALLAVIPAVGMLWLLGSSTIEVWTNTGGALFPFSIINGAVLKVGVSAPNTAIELDNSVFWVGNDKHGNGIVYRAQGLSPQRVSTSPIERVLQSTPNIEQVRAWSYQSEGHMFYVLTGGGLETSLCYDVSTGIWHERAYLNPQGNYEQHLGACHMFAFGKHLVGSRVDGTIYELRNDVYSDNGSALSRERTFTHIAEEDQRIPYSRLVLDFESGVGTQAGQGFDPLVHLRFSRDGARTWSDWNSTSIGKAGQRDAKAVFRRLGVSETMTFGVRMTDPVKFALNGVYLK